MTDAGLAAASMASDDPAPAGPFHAGLTWDFGAKTWTTPYTIRDADDRCVVGHIESKAMAQRIVALLNGEVSNGLQHPALQRPRHGGGGRGSR